MKDEVFKARLQASRDAAVKAKAAAPKPPEVALDGSKGRLKCGACSSRKAVAVSGSGPHWGRLNCARCGTFLSWLSFDAAVGLGLVERDA